MQVQTKPTFYDFTNTPVDFNIIKDGDVVVVTPDQLVPFKHSNARKRKRNTQRENEILESMKREGIRDPLKVWIETSVPSLQILGGFGRWEKAQKLGIPCPCKIHICSEADASRLHLVDNTQREDLSFIDEADAAKSLFTIKGGDFEATRIELAWTPTKLRERLEISKCTRVVKDFVEAGRLELGHAILLAPYKQATQDKQAQDIVNSNISVKQLKEILGKVQIPLSGAKFNTSECDTCEFNTKDQLNLFDNIGEQAKCRKAACFREKTKSFLESVRVEAESRYGKVIFLSQTDRKQTTLLKPEAVGVEQFESGCSSCESNMTIMSDVEGHEGKISINQCIDKECYTKLTKAATGAKKDAAGKAPKAPQGKGSSTTTKANDAKSVLKGFKPTEKLNDHNKVTLRNAAADLFNKNQDMYITMQTASLVHTSGVKVDGNIIHGFDDAVKHCLTLDREALVKLSSQAYAYLISKTSQANSRSMIPIMINALKQAGEEGEQAARKTWVMNEETLKMYPSRELLVICEKSGIKEKVEATNKKWSDIKKLKVNDLIKLMVETQPASPLFAPDDYLSHVAPIKSGEK